MNESLTVSKAGLELITREEGVVLHIYKDQVGLDTIGVGHLLTPSEKASGIFKSGITRDQALDLLKKDVVATQNTIKKYIAVELNQNQFDALASMIFNTGPGPISTGNLGKLINAERFSEVPDEMMKWCHGGGQILPVLQKRRKTESTLFAKLVSTAVDSVSDPIQIQHDVAIPDHEPTIPQDDAPIQLSTWQKIQSGFLNLFKK